jgi:hypothetical protein
MKQLPSTIAPHREGTAHKLGTLGLIPKIAVVLTIVIASAFVTDTIQSSKVALDTTMKANPAESIASHVVVDGLHIAIPNYLAHFTIEQLIPLS